jgi:hypothetical protein
MPNAGIIGKQEWGEMRRTKNAAETAPARRYYILLDRARSMASSLSR